MVVVFITILGMFISHKDPTWLIWNYQHCDFLRTWISSLKATNFPERYAREWNDAPTPCLISANKFWKTKFCLETTPYIVLDLTLLNIELNGKGSSIKLTLAVTKSLVAPAHLRKIARRVKSGNARPMFEDGVFSNRPGQIDHTLANASDHTSV